jgi:hypothetical protein
MFASDLYVPCQPISFPSISEGPSDVRVGQMLQLPPFPYIRVELDVSFWWESYASQMTLPHHFCFPLQCIPTVMLYKHFIKYSSSVNDSWSLFPELCPTNPLFHTHDITKKKYFILFVFCIKNYCRTYHNFCQDGSFHLQYNILNTIESQMNFWNTCHLQTGYQHEPGSSKFLWNAFWLSVDYMKLYPTSRTLHNHHCENLKSCKVK